MRPNDWLRGELSSSIQVAALSLFGLIAPALGQKPSTDRLTEILDLKASGQYRAALDRCRETLSAQFQSGRLTPRSEAQAEFLLALADNLAVKLADHRGLIDNFTKLRESPIARTDAVLAGWIDHYVARHLLSAGQRDKAKAICNRLGYLRDFQVLGPLDNERGSGFRRSFPPENAPKTPLDFEASVEGKKRPVHWRRIRLDDVPAAILNLGARMRPSRQVLAYAAFAIVTENPMDLCLRLGSSGSNAIFVNGAKISYRDVQQRGGGWDQDCTVFHVDKGNNFVLVKLGTQGSAFAARMRLTLPDASPLPKGVRVTADRDTLREASARVHEAGKQELSKAKIGGTAWLTEELARRREAKIEDAQTGMLAYQLAYLLALRNEDDEAGRRDRKYARLATKLLPSFGPAWHLLGYTLIQRGASEADRETNARQKAYLQAVKVWPRSAESMRLLAEMELELRNNVTKAEQWTRRALSVNPSFVYGITMQLRLLRARESETGRLVALAKALADPRVSDHPDLLRLAIAERKQADDTEAVIALRRKLLDLEHEQSARMRLAEALFLHGDEEEGLELAKSCVRDWPQSRSSYSYLAFLLEGREARDEALAVWQSWLKICPNDDSAWRSIARIAAVKGDSKMEIHALETAVSLNKSLKQEARKLEYLKSTEKPFYAGFTFDRKKILAADKGPDPDAKKLGDSHGYIFRQTLVRAYRDGTTSRYVHFIARILSEEGVNRFDSYRPPFNGEDQTARILEARVTKKDGTTVRARLGRSYWVDLPPLAVGDLVEVAARVDDRSRSFFGDYFGFEHVFGGYEEVPCQREVLDLILEPGRKYYFQRVGAVPDPRVSKLADGSEHRRYELRSIPRRKTEERAPSIRERGPLLRVSTYGSWNEFAAWWWDLIRKQTVMTPEIRAKVAELTKGENDLAEKIRKIYEFVITDIRYKAWEFGVHGYKPYSIASIFARKHGDCKDKAILMNAMLSEIGIEAQPILIHADDSREKDDLTLPMVQHFNHCISYIPAQKGIPAQFLDGTAEYHPIRVLPGMDYGAKVLAVSGHSGKVLQIPWPPATDNQGTTKYVVELGKDGNARVTQTVRPRTIAAPYYRMRFGNEEGKRKEKLADELGRIFGKVRIDDMQFSDLRDLTMPVQYSVRFEVQGFGARRDGAWTFPAVFRPENLSRLTSGKDRRLPMLLGVPNSRRIEIEYRVPDDWTWDSLPESVALQTKTGSFFYKFEKEGNTLRVKGGRNIETQRIPASEYAEFQKLTRAIDDAERSVLSLKKKR